MAGNSYKATVKWAGDEFFIGTGYTGHAQVMDSKGDRAAATSPIEMLLVAVAGCTAMDVISILLKKRQNVTDYNVEVTGERVEEHPRKFIKFNVHHIVPAVAFRKGRGGCDRAFRSEILLGRSHCAAYGRDHYKL
jgi:putative redox protein